MYKKSVPILFIVIFMFAQYARQLGYLQCKVEYLTTETSARCDCEDKFGKELQTTGNEMPDQKNHFHASLDEYYLLRDHLSFPEPITQITIHSYLRIQSLSSYQVSIFHPPSFL